MSILTREELKALMAVQDGHCVSIYMPTEKAGREVRQNPIRLKNLLNSAETLLMERGLRKPDAEGLLSAGRELQNDNEFWQHQNDGFALFLSPSVTREFRLPLSLEEVLVVNTAFHFKPLIPLLHGDGRFFILTLSQNVIRLYNVTRFEIHEIDPRTISQSFAEYFESFEMEKGMQWRSGASSGLGGGELPGSYHGQGVGGETVKALLLQYMRKLDNGMREFLGDKQAPLLLAGVDYLVGFYRDANTYAYLVDEWIEGNPEDMSEKALHKRGWEIMAPRFTRQQEMDADLYRQSAAAGDLSSDRIEMVIPAAYFGRVATLFVDKNRQVWGSFDPDTQQLVTHQEQREGEEDLLNFAAMHTLLNGGTVYAVEADQVPSGTALAAILRY